MVARVEVAQALVADTLLSTDGMVQWLRQKQKAEFNETIFSTLASSRYFEMQGDSFYILNSQGRVILISEPYDGYYGLDFSSMVAPVSSGNIQVSYQQSLLTNEPVITLQYPIEDGDVLVVERNLAAIIPHMVNFAAGEFFAGELFFVLDEKGKAVYHPDVTLMQSRRNVGFDLKERSAPATDGLFGFTYRSIDYRAVSLRFDSPAGWEIYYAIPQAVFVEEVKDDLIQQLSLLFLVFLIIFFTLRYFMNRFFSQPIRHIVGALTQDKKNDLLIPLELATGVKEFGAIIQAVNSRDQQVSRTLERFQSVLDGLDSLVYVADMQTYELLFLNQFGRNIFGDGVGQKCYQVLQSGQDSPCEFCTNGLLLDGQGCAADVHVWEFQNTVDHEWYECRDQAIRWTDGQLVRLEIATNISARKQGQTALLQEKERLAVTLRSIGDGVITTDVDGKVVLVNRVAEVLTGWSQAEAAGQPLMTVFNIVNKHTQEQCVNPVLKIYERGEIIALENDVELVAQDGTRRIIDDSGAPIRGQDSQIIGAVLVFRDVTEELRQEEELQKARKLESVGVLAGGIAHDFNNILSAILGYTELSMFEMPTESPISNNLKHVHEAGQRAKELVKQILTIARQSDQVMNPVSVGSITKEALKLIRSSIPSSIEIIQKIESKSVIMGDSTQIHQILMNLCTNAAQSMEKNGGELSVHVSDVFLSSDSKTNMLNLKSGNYVKLTVSDNGEGIPSKNIKSIFEPYYSTKEPGEGTGLGLAIVHGIIKSHGGEITVNSAIAKGSEFIVYFPITKESEETQIHDQKILPTGREHILFVDDEDPIVDMSTKILKRLGYSVTALTNSLEALELFRSNPDHFDLVITDMTMPKMTGDKLAAEMLKIRSDIPVIICTGYSKKISNTIFGENHIKAICQKPLSMNELATKIREVLS
jgi:PAS domain S-box-containing protein